MFVKSEETKPLDYDILEGCYGTVEKTCRKGAYLILDNGELAFAYKFGNLKPGTQVLCTVRKPPYEDKRKLVTIDSVCCYPTAA